MKKGQKQKDGIDNLAALKRKINEAFIEYRCDLSSKKPLGKLASYFAIPLDLSRLEDYYVRGLEIDELSISVVDKKTGTIYRSSYTHHTKLLPYPLTSGLYLETFSCKDMIQTQKLYRVSEMDHGSIEPITSELIITHGERALVFEKPYSELFDSRPFKISLEVSKPTYNDVSKRELLYAKTLTSPLCKTRGGLGEEVIAPMHEHITWQRINILKSPALYYRLDRTTEDSHIFGYVRDRSSHIQSQLEMHLIHLVEIAQKGKPSTNFIDIHKHEDVLCVNCQVDSIPFHFEIFNKVKGPLAPIELGEIIEILQATFPNRKFIQTALFELREFGHKLCIYKGLESAPKDAIALEDFANLSFEEIERMITADIDVYFKVIEEEYEARIKRLTGQKSPSTYQIKPNKQG